jgi:hypothetical protein
MDMGVGKVVDVLVTPGLAKRILWSITCWGGLCSGIVASLIFWPLAVNLPTLVVLFAASGSLSGAVAVGGFVLRHRGRRLPASDALGAKWGALGGWINGIVGGIAAMIAIPGSPGSSSTGSWLEIMGFGAMIGFFVGAFLGVPLGAVAGRLYQKAVEHWWIGKWIVRQHM